MKYQLITDCTQCNIYQHCKAFKALTKVKQFIYKNSKDKGILTDCELPDFTIDKAVKKE